MPTTNGIFPPPTIFPASSYFCALVKANLMQIVLGALAGTEVLTIDNSSGVTILVTRQS